MKPYTFFKHDGSTVPPVFELGEFEGDEEAGAQALRLLAEGPQYRAVEVWDGEADPFTVMRPGEAHTAPPSIGWAPGTPPRATPRRG